MYDSEKDGAFTVQTTNGSIRECTINRGVQKNINHERSNDHKTSDADTGSPNEIRKHHNHDEANEDAKEEEPQQEPPNKNPLRRFTIVSYPTA